MAPISDDLVSIRKTAKELNAIADEATKQIRALNECLGDELGIEHVDTIPFYYGRERNGKSHVVLASYSLVYGRDDSGKYGLCVQADVEVTDDYGNNVIDDGGDKELGVAWTRPLDQGSRSLRISVLARLPHFLSSLAGKLAEVATEAKKDLNATRAVLDEMNAALKE